MAIQLLLGPGDRVGHYTVVGPLGSGSMGAVYRAKDATLGRDVALKVLPPDMAQDAERLDRFRREARAVAALNHPHIVTIYSVEHADGTHFLTMELVEGRTLEALMAEGALAIDGVPAIGRQIADAVAVAHERGIVHRDLKPANVIVDERGRVKVLDFGLAKTRSPSPVGHDAATALATQPGAVLGTPAYMSPEQVKGLDVDHRTDIFSLGVILYEMAAGRHPFRGRSAAELTSAILRDVPLPVTAVRASVPFALARVINRCLEKEPSARFASMSEISEALQPAAFGVQIVGAEAGRDLFSDGVEEKLVDALTQIDGLQDDLARVVVERLKATLTTAAATRLAGPPASTAEAYALYLRGRALLLARGSRVAPGIACLRQAVALDPCFAAAWAGLADAYSICGYWGMAPPGETMPKALTAARRAVELDPALAEAHCALALALLLWERDYAAADAAFRRCLDLNPRYTQGRSWYAIFDRQLVHGRMDEGVAEARKALEADPLSAYATAVVAFTLGLAGRTDAALETARLAVHRDPESLFTRWTHAIAAHWCGAYEEAVAAFTAAGAVSARHVYTVSYAAASYAKWGRLADARALHEEGVALSTTSYVPRAALSVSAAAVGELDRALEFAQQACDEREPVLIVLARVFPDWGRLREHAAFARILRRLALPS